MRRAEASSTPTVDPVLAHVRSVNVVHAVIPDVLGDLDLTAIDKRPQPGRVQVTVPGDGQVGLSGDEVRDTRHHGGRDKAVYAYAAEDLAWWAAELGRDLADGSFGENLTTTGLDVTGAVIGERWAVGDDGLVLEVTYPRIPCRTFQGFMAEHRWVKRFYAHGASGAYLRVVTEGTVGAGDTLTVTQRPQHGVTIGEVFDLTATASDRLHLLLAEQEDLGEALASAARRILAARDR